MIWRGRFGISALIRNGSGHRSYPGNPGYFGKNGAFVGVCAFFFLFFAMHRGSWRYVSIPDLTTIIKATVFSVLVYTVGAFLMTRGSNVPRSVPVLTTLYMIAGLSASRLAYRLLLEHSLAFPTPSQLKKTARSSLWAYRRSRKFHSVDPARRQSRNRRDRYSRRRLEQSEDGAGR